jgi:putative addiction module component (TIGR02574 family)
MCTSKDGLQERQDVEDLSDADLPLTAAQEAELDRRIAALDQEREHAIPWDALKAKLAQHCQHIDQ